MPFLQNLAGIGGGGGGGVGVTVTTRVATLDPIPDLTAGTPVVLDGVPLNPGDVVLVKDQLDQTQNGPYTISVLGGLWVRSSFADTGSKLGTISLVFVEEGDVQADTLWSNATNPPIVLGVTPIFFVPYASPDLLVPFAFDTPSPLPLAPLDAGAVIEWAQVIIQTTFDDAAATLELGTVADPDVMMEAGDNDPTRLATFQVSSPVILTAADVFQLTITPGAATQGAGFVLARVRL